MRKRAAINEIYMKSIYSIVDFNGNITELCDNIFIIGRIQLFRHFLRGQIFCITNCIINEQFDAILLLFCCLYMSRYYANSINDPYDEYSLREKVFEKLIREIATRMLIE